MELKKQAYMRDERDTCSPLRRGEGNGTDQLSLSASILPHRGNRPPHTRVSKLMDGLL